jgi:hypothetical protein
MNKEKSYKLLLGILITISIALIVFSFFAPSIFVNKAITSNLNFTETGNIGATFGIMSPFIALAGVLVTFLAFYIQFKFNEFQINQFRSEFKLNQEKYERDKFENQFYEMLRLHKENVNELYIKTRRKYDSELKEETVYGRRVFEFFIKELSLAFLVAQYSFKHEELTSKQLLNEAYGVFFHGLLIKDLSKHQFFQNLRELQLKIEKFDYEGFDKELEKHMTYKSGDKISGKIDLNIFEGYNDQLAHYYRHLFQTVKFIAKQDEKLISYSQKRNYLRILRAQLSNNEQALIFYNWHSDFGKQWEGEENKFLTDYRMIHNLYNDILISKFDLEKIFDVNSGYRKEPNRQNDSLFAYQDW